MDSNQTIMGKDIRMFSYGMLVISLLLFASLAGCEGPAGSDGAQGPEGPQGEQGPVGPAGEDGSMIFSGTGGPAPNLGSEGDYYLNSTTGEFFGPKTDSGWGNAIMVLKGEDGQDGEDGSQIYAGSGSPDASLGMEGDYYLDQDNYQLYGPKSSSDWGSPINLKGEDGNANVTVYRFDGPGFTDANPDTTYSISGLTREQADESAWSVYLVRGIFRHEIPGILEFGVPPYEFSVRWIYENEEVKFTIEKRGGSDYYPDEIRIVRIAANNVVDNRAKQASSPLAIPQALDLSSMPELINYVGIDQFRMIDKRTD